MSASLAAAKQAGREAAFHSERVKTTKELCFFSLFYVCWGNSKQRSNRKRQREQPRQRLDLTKRRLPLMMAPSIAFQQVCSHKPGGEEGEEGGASRMSNQVCEKGQG